VVDDPCLVVLSSAGLLSRFAVDDQNQPAQERAVAPTSTPDPSFQAGDIVVTSLATTARASIGAVTTAGRMIRFNVIEIPVAPSAGRAEPGGAGPGTAGSLAGGHPVAEFVTGLNEGETVLALASLDGGENAGVVLGTASGIVKRVLPDYPANRDEFELITLKDDDRVVGAAYLASDDAELVFITTDAQLLRFGASSVRPQGRQAGGMTGIRLSDGASIVWFGAIGPAATTTSGTAASTGAGAAGTGASPAAGATGPAATAVVVTVAGRSGALPGTGGASVKVTPFTEYPPKGRATGGVRCQRFLRGEDGLILAWIGHPPVLAATESGVMVDLADMQGKRDASGTALTRQLTYLGPALA
jgi:DNA gyrase subunit A